MKHLKLLKIIKTQLKSERKNKQLSPRIANSSSTVAYVIIYVYNADLYRFCGTEILRSQEVGLKTITETRFSRTKNSELQHLISVHMDGK